MENNFLRRILSNYKMLLKLTVKLIDCLYVDFFKHFQKSSIIDFANFKIAYILFYSLIKFLSTVIN